MGEWKIYDKMNQNKDKIGEKLIQLQILTDQLEHLKNIHFEYIEKSVLDNAIRLVNKNINKIWDSK